MMPMERHKLMFVYNLLLSFRKNRLSDRHRYEIVYSFFLIVHFCVFQFAGKIMDV